MDEKTILEEFKKLRPFSDSVVKDPLTNDIIDVESINKDSFNDIISTLEAVKKTKKPEIHVIQGEPGSGKSHLLARIYRNAEKERFLFALYNPKSVNSKQIYSSLLKSLFSCFETTHPELKSKPINHIKGEIIKIGLRNYPEEKVKGKLKALIEEIKHQENKTLPYSTYITFTSINKEDQKVLRSYIINETLKFIKEKSEKQLGKIYLKPILSALINEETYDILLDLINEGNLDKESTKKISLSSGFAINEDIAEEMLASLVLISPFPILISIDQLEHIDSHLSQDEIKNTLETIIDFVINSTNVALLLSAQTQIFQKWRGFLPQHLQQRLTKVATLKPMTFDEGLEIIKKRNAHYFSLLSFKPDNALFPFDENKLRRLMEEYRIRSPRGVIKLADQLLNGEQISVKKETVKEIFNKILQKTKYEVFKFDERFGELLIALLNGKRLYERSKKLIIQVNDKIIAIDNSHTYFSTVKKLSALKRKKKFSIITLVREKDKTITEKRKSYAIIQKDNIQVRYFTEVEGKEIIAAYELLSYTESQDYELDLKEVKDFVKNFVIECLPKTKEINNPEILNILERIKKDLQRRVMIVRLSTYTQSETPEVRELIIEKLKELNEFEVKERDDGDYFILRKPA
ncbi:MAG: hypothetical protein K6343_01590 [Caldisericaceae bacterium]